MSVETVRLLIGDTDSNDELLTDAQIEFFLTDHGGQVYFAAADAAGAIAAKFARMADMSADDVSVRASQKHAQYLAMAGTLRKQATEKAATNAMPYAGGISKADKETREADTDRVRPAFRRETGEVWSARTRHDERD